jgi:hypothetical protein
MNTSRQTLNALDYAIILLTVATAAIHFTLVFPSAMFIINALGYLALLAALYLPIPGLPFDRDKVRGALIGYTAFTVGAWLFTGSRIPIAYLDKVIEVTLIALLVIQARRAS